MVGIGLLVIQMSFPQADCILGVGITDDNQLIEIFQMNTAQKESLISFSAELKYRNEILNNNLDNIKNRHPQSTVTELTKLANEYRKVMDSMYRVQVYMDKKMLKLFNSNQYELYRLFCKEAMRSPFVIIPKVYSDSIQEKRP